MNAHTDGKLNTGFVGIWLLFMIDKNCNYNKNSSFVKWAIPFAV